MDKTTKYQLNQWSAEDLVLRTDFNADNTKLEAALSGLDTSISSLNSSVSTINTNLSKKASTTSLNSAVSRISSLESGKVDKTAHTSDVSALRGENCWVKLGEKYTTADGQTARVPIANISAYRELEIVFRGACVSATTGSIMLTCNDVTSPKTYSSQNSFSGVVTAMYLARLPGSQGGGTAHLFPLWPNGQTALYTAYVSKSKNQISNKYWHGDQYEAVFEEITWDSITSLTLSAPSSDGGFIAGSGMTVYGLKK